jgi:hypothetical protein
MNYRLERCLLGPRESKPRRAIQRIETHRKLVAKAGDTLRREGGPLAFGLQDAPDVMANCCTL